MSSQTATNPKDCLFNMGGRSIGDLMIGSGELIQAIRTFFQVATPPFVKPRFGFVQRVTNGTNSFTR